MKARIAVVVVAVCHLLSGSEVAEAAHVQGRISAGPSLQSPPALSVAVDAWVCGEDGEIADPRLVIGSERGLADVVVTVTNAGNAPPYPAAGQPAITQRGCVFTPHVVVVAPDQELGVGNDDRILHTFRAVAELNRGINRAQVGGKRDTVSFTTPEIVVLECDVHYWMSAVVVVAPHAFVAVSDADGNFRIDGMEPGRYDLALWHQRLGHKNATVVIEGETGRLEFTWE